MPMSVEMPSPTPVCGDGVRGHNNEENRVSVTDPTMDELRIAESYQRVLDQLSRCAQAVRDGDWHHLAAVAGDLSRGAVHLGMAAGELRDPGTGPRAEVVLDMVASRNGSPAARALHPARPSLVAKTALTDPFTHPGG